MPSPLSSHRLSVQGRSPGFTLVELLIVIGIIGILASVVIVAVGPTRALEAVRNAERKMHIRQVENAGTQHQIGTGLLPSQNALPLGGDNALPICRKGVTNAECVNIDTVMPTYITDLPIDVAEKNTTITGYRVYTDAQTRMHVCSPYLSAGDNDRCTGVILSSTCIEDAQYPISVGSNPRSSTLLGAKLYVNNYSANTVSVINTLTDTVTATIPVGAGPQSSTAVGTKVYVNNYLTNTVSVIDTTTDTVTSTITTGASPNSSYLIGTKLYVVTSGNVYVVDTTTDTVTANIALGGGATPIGAVVVGTKLYVLGYATNTVYVIDSATNTVVANMLMQGYSIAGTAIGTKLFVQAGYWSLQGGMQFAMYVFDTNTNTLITSTLMGSTRQASVAVGSKLYVMDSIENTVRVINSTTNTQTAVMLLPVSSYPQSAVSIDTKLYIMDGMTNKVSIIDTLTDTVLSHATVGSNPQTGTVVGKRLYVQNGGSDSVSVLTASGGTVCQ